MLKIQRRKFLQTSALLSSFPFASFGSTSGKIFELKETNRFKLSLNAYSFNAPLRAGKTNLLAVIDFCASHGFEAVDLTGYYFPGYPEVPSDDYIFQLKRTAHTAGIAISGTGIRTDFTEPEKSVRAKDVDLTKKWIEVAAKLGAPVIRIFSGRTVPANYTRAAVYEWMLADIRSCVEHAKKFGVIVSVQNHNDFLKTADETIDMIKNINSEWFGLVLDTGSYVTNEPYQEIEKTCPYAVNWQIKERLNYNGKPENMDLVKLFRIIKRSSYRGYLPIETLSPGDPFVIVPPFLKQVADALQKA